MWPPAWATPGIYPLTVTWFVIYPTPSLISFSVEHYQSPHCSGEPFCAIWGGDGNLLVGACTLAVFPPNLEVPLPGHYLGHDPVLRGRAGEEVRHAGGGQELQPPCPERES